MKTTVLFKAVAVIALMVAGVMNSDVKAQSQFVTNEVMNGEQVASKTIFKKDGAYLYRHIKYDYTYDNNNRLTGKTAYKWNGLKEAWDPYFKLTYQYSEKEITSYYARWNADRRAYDASEKSVYELNDANIPVAYNTYKRGSNEKSDWTLVSHKVLNNDAELFATAD